MTDTMPDCALCQKQFAPFEAIAKMFETMPLSGVLPNLPGIPFVVLVHRDCQSEYEYDRQYRPFRIAEQIAPWIRRRW